MAANSTVQGLIWLNFKPIRDFIVVLVFSKNNEDQIKNEGARVVTTLFIDFSVAQGQLTPKYVMESCQNTNQSKILWLFSSAARLKKNQSKIKELEQ